MSAPQILREIFLGNHQFVQACGKEFFEGSLTIVGAIYDFANTYGRGYGRIIIANINGQTKREELLNHPALKEIEPSFREEIVL